MFKELVHIVVWSKLINFAICSTSITSWYTCHDLLIHVSFTEKATFYTQNETQICNIIFFQILDSSSDLVPLSILFGEDEEYIVMTSKDGSMKYLI